MNDEMISVIEAGRQLERRKSTIFKVMKRLGIHSQKRRDANSGNQIVSYLTMPDFLRVKAELSIERIEASQQTSGDLDGFVSAEVGVFYLIQLEPEHDPMRFKVGSAANINDRLWALRCSAPFSQLLQTWPCKRLWERTAIDCVTVGTVQLHTEVFRCSDIEQVRQRCDQFFAMMPSTERT